MRKSIRWLKSSIQLSSIISYQNKCVHQQTGSSLCCMHMCSFQACWCTCESTSCCSPHIRLCPLKWSSCWSPCLGHLMMVAQIGIQYVPHCAWCSMGGHGMSHFCIIWRGNVVYGPTGERLCCHLCSWCWNKKKIILSLIFQSQLQLIRVQF